MFLVGPKCIHRVYSSEVFVAAYVGISGMRRMLCRALFVGAAAHYECCFTTMFDMIFLSELTTAAQVSSAEDSKASTVKNRAFCCERRRDQEGLMTHRSIPGE